MFDWRIWVTWWPTKHNLQHRCAGICVQCIADRHTTYNGEQHREAYIWSFKCFWGDSV